MRFGVKCREAFPQFRATFEAFSQVTVPRDRNYDI